MPVLSEQSLLFVLEAFLDSLMKSHPGWEDNPTLPVGKESKSEGRKSETSSVQTSIILGQLLFSLPSSIVLYPILYNYVLHYFYECSAVLSFATRLLVKVRTFIGEIIFNKQTKKNSICIFQPYVVTSFHHFTFTHYIFDNFMGEKRGNLFEVFYFCFYYTMCMRSV